MATSMSESGKTEVGGYVYVIGFNDGLVKVGRTQNPKVRLSTIRGAAGTHRMSIASNWLSPLHKDFKSSEKALIQAIKEAGGETAQREYFRGVNFDRAVSEAEALDYPEFDLHAELMKHTDEGREFRNRMIDRAMARSGNLDDPLAPFFHSPEVLAEHRRNKAEATDRDASAVIGGLLTHLSAAAVHDIICLALNDLKARDVDILIHNDTIQTDFADIALGEDSRFRSLYYCPKIEDAASKSPLGGAA